MSTGMSCGGDVIGALVFDVGNRSIRAGYAMDDVPVVDVPAVVGVSVADVEDTVAGTRLATGDTKYYKGVTSLCVPRADMEVKSCMKDSMIEDWDLFEQLIEHCYSKRLNTNPQQHPVLFSEPSFNEKSKREKLVELMFEKFNVPAFYICNSAVLAAFSCGRSTGIVVDSGATHTTVIPVVDGSAVHRGIIKSPLGGDFVSKQCLQFIYDSQIILTPQYMIAQKQPVKEKEKAVWTKKTNVPKVKTSWHDYMTRLTIEDFKHSVLQITEQPYNENEMNFLTSSYEFPDGYNQEFGKERFKIPESLFNPSLVMSDPMLSPSCIVTTSAGLCSADVRPNLYSNVIVTGGNTLLQGFSERLCRDLTSKIPPNTRMKMIVPSGPINRQFGAWIGGSIVTSSETFQQMWYSHQEYNEGGKGQIHNICP